MTSAERLDSFLELEENWDGYGARKITEYAVNSAKIFLEATGMTNAPVFPTVVGGVLVEWASADLSTVVSIEFYPKENPDVGHGGIFVYSDGDKYF